MAALSTIFNFEHPAFEFYLYDLAQDIALASRDSILLGIIFYHGAGLMQWLLVDQLAPGYIHVAQIGVRLFALADFIINPVRSSLNPIHQKPHFCVNKRPFLHQYIQGALRFTIAGASFSVSKYFNGPLRALHPYAPALIAAIFTTYGTWGPFIRVGYLEESFAEIFRRYCLFPIRRNLYNRRSLLSSSFIVLKSSAPLFEYPQLSAGNMIRLLRMQIEELAPNRVSCELLAVDVDTAPPYDAISYAWGSSEYEYSLLVGDTVKQYIPITASAGNTLRAVTPLCGTYYLWIDSICINQGDEAENRDSGVLAVQPDHKRSVKEVYANVVKLALQTGSFYTFSMSGLSNRQEGGSLSKLSHFQARSGLSGLPSWIPDLTCSQTRDTSRYHGRDYTAGAKIPVEFDISAQQDQLKLKGVFLDTFMATSLHSDVPEAIRLAIEDTDHLDGLQLGRDVWGRLIEMLKLFELYLPIVQDQYSEADPRECFWQTITDDFDGQKYSERDKLTRVLQDLERFVAGVKEELSQPLLEEEKFSVREIQSFLSSSEAAKKFWPKNDESEIIKLFQATFAAVVGISERGFLALAPLGTKAGDIIVVFQGSPVPHILRASGKDDGSYFIWGEAYVHGVMYGKAMDVEKTWFVLC